MNSKPAESMPKARRHDLPQRRPAAVVNDDDLFENSLVGVLPNLMAQGTRMRGEWGNWVWGPGPDERSTRGLPAF